jgi:hypothetical protein
MNPVFMFLANRSLPFDLYDLHLERVSAKELAPAYSRTLFWVEEQLEAVRLCIKSQAKLSLGAKGHATETLAA